MAVVRKPNMIGGMNLFNFNTLCNFDIIEFRFDPDKT